MEKRVINMEKIEGLEVKTCNGYVEVEAELHEYGNNVHLTVSDGCGDCGTTSTVSMTPTQAEMLAHILEETKAVIEFGTGDYNVRLETEYGKRTVLTVQEGIISVTIPQHKEFALRKSILKAVRVARGEPEEVE